ncbi:uncharacterized protein K460DRAFT_395710 [Cucurbitaria berberidis CBS 394.84]|uniref:Uncharacterized protein n=1 Tax=Cucurbitaria berberidis CBS 394.84 TaxID=1168544 RepID=A0A9P4GIH3_9PLEO|nr:uncharacterized protein K460DRAFT_395710 [Cucurbitaria berberidis CBS 394.84]KAF1846257.1 hypothetical protein K460DRAFT_395710 [Cucurbitaria berberidis CBS 394.84]
MSSPFISEDTYEHAIDVAPEAHGKTPSYSQTSLSPQNVAHFGNVGFLADNLLYVEQESQQLETLSTLNSSSPPQNDVGLHQTMFGSFGESFTTVHDGSYRPSEGLIHSQRLDGQNTALVVVPPALSQVQQTSQPRQANGVYFDNFNHGINALPPFWRCPANDTSIPTTDDHRQYWAGRLLAGMNNLTDVFDKPSAAFRKHWFDPSWYTAPHRESVCWEILAIAEGLHRSRPFALQTFDPQFWKQTFKTRDWTFSQRMEKIITLLTYSKARCERLLGGMSMHHVVGNPVTLLSSTRGNAKQNRRRQDFLEAGREAQKLDPALGVVEDPATSPDNLSRNARQNLKRQRLLEVGRAAKRQKTEL